MKRFVVATSGHVDHGKTTLVRALTGFETDRLPEEKSRGISIELGFAPLLLRSDLQACIVDVPGHERFVRVMVQGATGADCALLVIAANEGFGRQTREHLEILHLLGIRNVVCAATKCDKIPDSDLSAILDEFRDELSRRFERPVPVHAVNALRPTGLEALKRSLLEVGDRIERNVASSQPFLPIDRVFSRTGFGTVVTGTLVSGVLRVGDRVRILPSDQESQVRSLEIFGDTCTEASARTRLAVNLARVKTSSVKRGEVLVSFEGTTPSQRARVEMRWLDAKGAPTSRRLEHLRFLSGTQDLECRFVPKAREIRFASAATLRTGEPFILRSPSPAVTLGGGTVLDSHPPSRKSFREKAPATPQTPTTEPTRQAVPAWITQIEEAGFSPPTVGEICERNRVSEASVRGELALACRESRLVRVSDQFYIAKKEVPRLIESAKRLLSERKSFTLSDWKESIQLSRKYVVPLLEFLDQEKITICKPDRTRIAGPNLNVERK